MRKLIIFISLFLILFFCFVFVLFVPRNYKVTYKYNKYEIDESYNKNEKKYTFVIKNESKIFPLVINSKYSNKRKKIQNLKFEKLEKEECLIVSVFNELFPVCYKNNELVAHYVLKEKKLLNNYKEINNDFLAEKIIEKYENIEIYNYLNKNYFIWNYNGYTYLSNEKKSKIYFENVDNYENALAYKFDKYLLTPNYINDYYFKEFYVIDAENLELSILNFDTEISYETYFMGNVKNNLYLLDRKNQVQYKMNIKKSNLKKIGDANSGISIFNNSWENISMKNAIKENLIFNNNKQNFELAKNKLYYVIEDNKMLISEKNVSEIVYVKNNDIYYIAGDSLYYYSYLNNEIKLFSNSEWNFNYKNIMFVFD